MASTTELIIKINGDVTNFQEALKQAQEKTGNLQEELTKAAEVSAIAFASLTAAVGLSVAAYADHEKATKSLTLSLQNQGIYSQNLLESYEAQAKALSLLTGIDEDSIASGQSRLQNMIGQVTISKDLTKAMVDLSSVTGSVDGAAEILGRAIQGNTRVLKEFGIQIDTNLDKNERLAKIVEIVTQKFGGQAEVMNQGLGSIKGLKTAFDDAYKAIGERFAPVVELVIGKLTTLFRSISENKALVDLVASLLFAGTAVSGLVLAVTAGSVAFLKFQAALEAAGIATEGMSLAVKGLVGATGIGLILILVSELYLHWNDVWPKMQQVFQAFAENISGMVKGLAFLISGAFTLNIDQVMQGWNTLKEAIKKTYADVSAASQTPIKAPPIDANSFVAQNEAKKALADKAEAEERAREANKLAQLRVTKQIEFLTATDASKDLIDLKKKELETLKALQEEHDASIVNALRNRLEMIRALEDDARQNQVQKENIYFNEILDKQKEFQDLTAEEQVEFIAKNQQALIDSLDTENDARQKLAQKELQISIQSHNQMLADQQKFGKSYALINQLMHSEIYEGSKKAFSDLAELQSSSNDTLKTIGKIAAIANIIIKTAESAMNIYAGFSIIPIIGPELGAIGAAAAVAFGGEQIAKVTAAAQGGLISGGIPGVDSVPVLAQRGELVSPAQNFEEVIGSVRAARESEKYGGGGQQVDVTIGFKDNAFEIIEKKILQRRATGVGVI